jgi:signal transduction histidine kinase
MSADLASNDSFYAEISHACERFEAEWQSGKQPRIELYVAQVPEGARPELIRELLKLDTYYRRDRGDTILPEDYKSRYPEHASLIDTLLGPSLLAELPIRLTHAGRYRLEQYIAGGGMGDVWRAHDPDFRRPLAVKILKEEFKDRPDLVARFLEEAQITGQLQHPGVPPVHEIGRLADGRPFMAMKLIEGHTLADLLAERKGASDGLPRFLTIFEHVCQAVAYAHSRRVIHRDLKPANVMVGAFGEVQVMDWGLAKVLATECRRSATSDISEQTTYAPVQFDIVVGPTRPGAVMGTLAFMPPEQARGEIDKLDERSDVFSLGAMLCEVLTGNPPYREPSPEKRWEQAKTANLADAFARLEAARADAGLIALSRRCLASEMGLRPDDASVVAKAVAAYQADVQERLRKAESEAAKAASRAKSLFLANMSHQFRTPLHSILGMIELVLETELSCEQRRDLEMVRASAEEMFADMSDSFDFTTIELGMIELQATAFRLRKSLNDWLKALASRAQQQGLQLAWEIEPGVPDDLVGDPERLRQILIHVVGNVIKFTDQGEVVLRVAVEERTEESARLHFEISAGISIPPDKLSDISRTRRRSGTGLGLAISRQLVEMMGGQLAVDSQPGRGNGFQFTAVFQMQKGQDSGSAPAPTSPGPSSPMKPSNTP